MAAEWWTDERVEKLKVLVAEGQPYSTIGRMLGTSRNSCLGKATRLGIAKSHAASPHRTGRHASRRHRYDGAPIPNRTRRTATPRPSRPFDLLPDAPAERPEAIVVPEAERRQLVDLEPTQCHWPMGDPLHADFHFCNRSKVAGLPYCDTHARVAYVAPPVRQRSPQPSAPRPVQPVNREFA